MIRSFAFIAVALLLCVGSIAEAQQDFSNETYLVDFMPWANRKIAFRAANGDWIGYSKTQAPFQIKVDGNAYRAAQTPDGIDIGKLLRNMSPRRGTDGHLYLSLSIQQNVKLDDESVLSAQTVAADGTTKPTEVLIDIDDFYVTKSLQPANSSTSTDNAPAPEQTQVSNFNETLARDGVTAATRPDDRIEDTTPLDTLPDENEEDEQDTTPAGYVVRLGNGSPFPERFLSSPLCSKSGERHVTTSGMGPRGRRVGSRNGKPVCVAHNGRRMSCNHKGLDIAAGVGTPVLAAADGCFKVKKSAGRRNLPAAGTAIDKRDLREGGYGYTIRLTHGNDWETQYSHLSRLSPKVRWGMCVKRGEVIGYSGNTGQVTGAHFHFGVAHGRYVVNPVTKLLSTTGDFLSPSCNAVPTYPDLDSRMRSALRAGTSGGSVGTSNRSRSAR
jgi:murein DD-endopeptidase MepM/ murein hydrolase activator NlpD